MTDKPTEPAQEKLLPCPFCAVQPDNNGFTPHHEHCFFILKALDKEHDGLRLAWNTRDPLYTEALAVKQEPGMGPREYRETATKGIDCGLRLADERDRLAASLQSAREIITDLIKSNPVFRSMPVGAPNSQARDEQLWKIGIEDKARAWLENNKE